MVFLGGLYFEAGAAVAEWLSSWLAEQEAQIQPTNLYFEALLDCFIGHVRLFGWDVSYGIKSDGFNWVGLLTEYTKSLKSKWRELDIDNLESSFDCT